MSTLQEFLNQNPVDNVIDEVAISERFKDKEGNYLKFKIKAMTTKEFENIRRKHMVQKKGGKVETDTLGFNLSIVINQTLEPNFKDAESIKALGCMTPEDYVQRVLLPGEISELVDKISKLSGFDQDINDLVEEAKN